MQKLIIADDERVIRETIYSLIDWQSLGIEVIGLCKDGIEAYNMILDESPDIVMTDIRMPGLSGLDLVKEISGTDKQIQFIILSGYEEFDYARKAMEYGVKYYLLKPCNEETMIESIKRASEDAKEAKRQIEESLRQSEMLRTIHQEALYHMLMDGIALEETENDAVLKKLESGMRFHGQYQDFDRGPCYLYYIYYLKSEYLDSFLSKMKKYTQQGVSPVVYGVYVKNSLLLFSYELLDEGILRSYCGFGASLVEIKKEEYSNIPSLLGEVIQRIRRYDTIYAIHNFKIITILNNQNIIRYIQANYKKLKSTDLKVVNMCLNELMIMAKEASQLEFLQMLGNSICTRLSEEGAYSMLEEIQFFRNANQEKDIDKLRQFTIDMINKAKHELCGGHQKYGVLAEQVMAYVKEHLSEYDLTLKKIAEHHLYMNVDYVSRKFYKSTGKKFSQYLAEQRVEKAKELLSDEETNKIQYVAERVGCGNNPQYFSQVFKKIEGITPGKWVAKMRSKA